MTTPSDLVFGMKLSRLLKDDFGVFLESVRITIRQNRVCVFAIRSAIDTGPMSEPGKIRFVADVQPLAVHNFDSNTAAAAFAAETVWGELADEYTIEVGFTRLIPSEIKTWGSRLMADSEDHLYLHSIDYQHTLAEYHSNLNPFPPVGFAIDSEPEQDARAWLYALAAASGSTEADTINMLLAFRDPVIDNLVAYGVIQATMVDV